MATYLVCFSFSKQPLQQKQIEPHPVIEVRALIFIVQPNEKKRHQICEFAHVTDFIP